MLPLECVSKTTVGADAKDVRAQPPGARSYSAWEGEVTQLIADALNTRYSDAAGVVEGQPFYMQQSWGKGMTARQTAGKILVVVASAEGGSRQDSSADGSNDDHPRS